MVTATCLDDLAHGVMDSPDEESVENPFSCGPDDMAAFRSFLRTRHRMSEAEVDAVFGHPFQLEAHLDLFLRALRAEG